MRRTIQTKSEAGFSLIELLISMLILLPIMGAAISMFSVGVNQQVTEQGSIDVNQEARAGLEMTRKSARPDLIETFTQLWTQPSTPPLTFKQLP
jgi:prepilin-type N-terminal cleavage/methylation domain-containing protein